MITKGLCPSCEKESDLERHESIETLQVKGEEITVPVITFLCTSCGSDYYDPDTDHLENAYRAYRKKCRWTQPEEIVVFRRHYGFSQAELAELLGWSVATLSRYESGSLQSESHERVLSLLKEPANLLRFLREDQESFCSERRREILSNLFETVASTRGKR